MKRNLVWMAVAASVLGAPAWAQTSGSQATDHSSHGIAAAPAPGAGPGPGHRGGGMADCQMIGDGPASTGHRMMHGGGAGMDRGMMGGMGHGSGTSMHGGGMGERGIGMQGGGMGDPGMARRGRGLFEAEMMEGMGRGGGSMRMLAGLDLSEDQQGKVQKIHDDLRRRNWDAMGKMLDERARLRDLYAAPGFDRSALAATYKRIGELRQQMTEARLDAHAAVEQVLLPAQREKLRGQWKQMGRRMPG